MSRVHAVGVYECLGFRVWAGAELHGLEWVLTYQELHDILGVDLQ